MSPDIFILPRNYWSYINLFSIKKNGCYIARWLICNLIKSPQLFNASFQDFWCTNINNHLFCFEITITTYLKAQQHEFLALNTYLSSFSKNQMLKYTFTLKTNIYMMYFNSNFLFFITIIHVLDYLFHNNNFMRNWFDWINFLIA